MCICVILYKLIIYIYISPLNVLTKRELNDRELVNLFVISLKNCEI